MNFVESAQEAVSDIASGEFVWCHSMAATPTVLLDALAEHALGLSDITLMHLHLEPSKENLSCPRGACTGRGRASTGLSPTNLNSIQAKSASLLIANPLARGRRNEVCCMV